jgi:hypothetical protein
LGLIDSILTANNGAIVTQISKQLGIPDSVAKQAVTALVPALSRGLERNAEKPGGLDSLLGALSNGNHSKYVDEPQTIGQEESIADGNAILGHIFGSKEVSRNVAGNASQKTGIDSDTLKKTLPMLATAAMGALAKQTGAGQSASGITGSQSGLGALAGMGGLGALGSLTGFLDQDADGDPTDDILNLAKKFF